MIAQRKSTVEGHRRKFLVVVDDSPEGSRALLDAGTYQLQDLAVELGATVQDFGFVTAAKLGTLDPQALRFAFLLQPGEHSPPYSAGDSLRIFKVRARQEPKILPNHAAQQAN